MSIYQKITELQQAFKEGYGVDVRIEAWVHGCVNDLTDERAVGIQSAISGESEALHVDVDNFTGGKHASFIDYKVAADNIVVHLTVDKRIDGGVENERATA